MFEKKQTSILSRFNGDSGSAILEFLIFGLAANLALLTFSVDLIQAQKNQLASDAIARHVSRDFSHTQSENSAQRVAGEVALSFNLQPNQWQIAAVCEPVECSADNALVKIQVLVENSVSTVVMPVMSDLAAYE